ncbi:MAG: glycosyl hydrolase, partial [Bacteroidales bacterium]|nr:glycosyl hydrolase [Bacteroidales bacterium]
EGAEINAGEVTEITITYNTQITLSKSERITLNGAGVNARVADGTTIVIPVALANETDYTLVIPDRAVTANFGLSFAPAFTLKFKTSSVETPPATHRFAPLTCATPSVQAINVYDFLIENHGKKILSGAMANVNNNNDFADWIYNVTGKYPALTGYDFIHLRDSEPGAWIDYTDIAPAAEQWENNGIVSYMWHWNAPDSEEDYHKGKKGKYGFYIPGKGSETTEFDIREALKEGTWQHEFILADIDKVAESLKLLQARGIPVLWRPLHEAAGDYRYGPWFWWGRHGIEYTRQLWILMYDRLVNHHGLDNLIWVWTAQYLNGHADDMAAAYPGDEYVDIVGVDLYPDNNNSQVEAYLAALDLTSGKKMVSLSEVGRIPDPQKCFNDGAYWAWFMEWYTYNITAGASQDNFGNTREAWTSVMTSPYIITRSQMPSLK